MIGELIVAVSAGPWPGPAFLHMIVRLRARHAAPGRHWHCSTHASIIPKAGTLSFFRLGDEQIILDAHGRWAIHAMLNVPASRCAEVCTKPKLGNARFFVCPYHAWTYAIDGSLRAARLMPKDFGSRRHGLKKLYRSCSLLACLHSFAGDNRLDFDLIEQSLPRTSCGQHG